MYNVSIELQNKINKIKMLRTNNLTNRDNIINLQLNFNNQSNTSSSGSGSVSTHAELKLHDITDVYFNIYDYKLRLNSEILMDPNRNPYISLPYDSNTSLIYIDNNDHIQRLIDMFNKSEDVVNQRLERTRLCNLLGFDNSNIPIIRLQKAFKNKDHLLPDNITDNNAKISYMLRILTARELKIDEAVREE
jgi:hypothetical protein